jgi:hypothetical protein
VGLFSSRQARRVNGNAGRNRTFTNVIYTKEKMRRSSVVFSATAKQNSLNPEAYMREVSMRIAESSHSHTPGPTASKNV